MPLKAVFLDAGYTLLHADPSLGGVYAGVARELGFEIPPARFEAAFGPLWERRKEAERGRPELLREDDAANREMWRGFTRDLLAYVPELAGAFEPWFDRLYARFGEAAVWKPYPEAAGALRTLRACGYRLAILSNWDSRLLPILAAHGLDALVDDVVVSARVGFRKPHPEIFRAACDRAGVRPGEALHVGDSVHDDLEGALAAGLSARLLCRGFEPPPGVPSVRDLRELSRDGLAGANGA